MSRMKGVSAAALKFRVDIGHRSKEDKDYVIKRGGDSKIEICKIVKDDFGGNAISIYEEILKNKAVVFDLLALGVKFKRDDHDRVVTFGKFERTITKISDYYNLFDENGVSRVDL